MIWFILFLSISFSALQAQSKVGEWDVHLNYSKGNCLFSKESTIYVGAKSQFFTYNQSDNSIEGFSKLNGLNDSNVTAINFDPESNVLILGYENGNVDLISSNQTINIPYIKNSANILGGKKINAIHVDMGVAYLSCSFGLVTIDISSSEILETYYFWNNGAYGNVVDCFVFDSSYKNPYLSEKIFVATDFGLFSASKNNPNLLDPNAWNSEHSVLNSSGGTSMSSFNGGVKKIIGSSDGDNTLILLPNNYNESLGSGECEILFFSGKENFFITHEVPQICNSTESIISAHMDGGGLMGFSYSNMFYIDDISSLQSKKTFLSNLEMFSLLPLNNLNGFNSILFKKNNNEDVIRIYFSDKNRGLAKFVIYQGEFYFDEVFVPNGPAANTFGDMSFVKDNLVVSHGGKNGSWNNLDIIEELSIYSDYMWGETSSLIDLEIKDALVMTANQSQLFVGTWNSGLLEFSDNKLTNVYNEKNSSLQSITSGGWIRVGGCCFDESNNLWVTNAQAESPISSLNNDVWESFQLNSVSTNTMIGEILCVSNGQKWIQSRAEGLVVFTNSTEKILAEKKLTSSSSYGNLPSNTVNSLSEDLDGSVWIGTSNGVGVFYFPDNIFTSSNFDCETPLIEVDGYVERLLYNTNVLDIEVDGGNRKWFATEGKGVFLMSEDGTEEIHHFTFENSPLLSNTVYKIEINPKSGEVFFATDLGLCSFRASATTAEETFENVLLFPNPVQKNYSGLITISGLTDNTNIKITDVSGNLVFETYSEGGSASWDGNSFSGKKVQTGVYLFFCSSSDFSETIVKKILIYN